jgi:hypothetical protein
VTFVVVVELLPKWDGHWQVPVDIFVWRWEVASKKDFFIGHRDYPME